LKARRSKNGSLAFFIAERNGKIQPNGTEEAKLCLNCIVENLDLCPNRNTGTHFIQSPAGRRKFMNCFFRKGSRPIAP
jgi:hypothetical protein